VRRSDGATVLVPDWSLNVLLDGSVEPLKPDAIRFRDGALIRPVCPFIGEADEKEEMALANVMIRRKLAIGAQANSK
jgi:hypothetical protein